MTSQAETVDLQVPSLSTELRLAVHGEADLHVSKTLRETGLWEPYETALLLDALAPGNCFLDVGANIGYFSVLAASRVGASGQVFAFEPEPGNAALLRHSVALNGFDSVVTVCEAALTDTAGEGRLYINPTNYGDHQLHAALADGAHKPEAISVPLVVGADWLSGRAARVDVVKVDVQGAEVQAIQGLLPILHSSLPELSLLIELSPRSLRLAGRSGRELITLLATLQLDFFIVDHLEHRLVPSTAEELAIWCDNVDAYPDDAGFMNIYLRSGL